MKKHSKRYIFIALVIGLVIGIAIGIAVGIYFRIAALFIAAFFIFIILILILLLFALIRVLFYKYYDNNLADFLVARGKSYIFSKDLSDRLYLRWAMVHFLMMICEMLLVAGFFHYKIWWIIYATIAIVLVFVIGFIPLYRIEKHVYNSRK